MQQYNEFRSCSKYLILKIFFVSILLQYCLSFVSIEEENPAIESSFYQNRDNGIWNILMKVPRGYMVPMPRVGRRFVHEVKRQNMIPQPRIGRQLDIDEELAKIFSEIQYFVTKSNLIPGHTNSVGEKFPSHVLKNLVDNGVNTANENAEIPVKESTFSSNENHDNSNAIEGEPTNSRHKAGDNKISISFLPNKDERYLAAEALISGIQMYDGEKGFIPISRQGRERILSALDENLDKDVLAYHRPCCTLWKKSKILIPRPSAGRLAFDPEDYDNLLNVDYTSPESEDSFVEYERRKLPPPPKIKRPKFIPRLGRKKRSISTDLKEHNQHVEDEKRETPLSSNDNSEFDRLDESEPDYLFTIGKSSSLNENAFDPRIDKKRSDYLEEYLEDKRAAAFTPRIGRVAMFTPRIGRAALIPRIGRTDPRLRLRSRSSFIPRIGRRAALIPRVGRSEKS